MMPLFNTQKHTCDFNGSFLCTYSLLELKFVPLCDLHNNRFPFNQMVALR